MSEDQLTQLDNATWSYMFDIINEYEATEKYTANKKLIIDNIMSQFNLTYDDLYNLLGFTNYLTNYRSRVNQVFQALYNHAKYLLEQYQQQQQRANAEAVYNNAMNELKSKWQQQLEDQQINNTLLVYDKAMKELMNQKVLKEDTEAILNTPASDIETKQERKDIKKARATYDEAIKKLNYLNRKQDEAKKARQKAIDEYILNVNSLVKRPLSALDNDYGFLTFNIAQDELRIKPHVDASRSYAAKNGDIYVSEEGTSVDENGKQLNVYKKTYLNNLKSLDYVMDTIRNIIVNSHKPAKFEVSFSGIFESLDKKSEQYQYKRDIDFKNGVSIAARTSPILIANSEDIRKFMILLNNTLLEYVSANVASTSASKLIYFDRASIVQYNVDLNAGRSLYGLELQIANKNIRYTDCKYNICFFIAYAHYINQRDGLQLNARSIIARATEVFHEYYNNRGTKVLKEYPGFNLLTEGPDFAAKYQINIDIYTNRDKTQKTLKYELVNEIKINPQYPTVSITQDLAMLNNSVPVTHVMFISNVEALMHVRMCPKCRRMFPVESTMLNRFNKHVASCDGTVDRHVKLTRSQLPYVPHIFDNPSYEYLLANDRINEYIPISNYMTYDFETMEEPKNEAITSSTTLISTIKPLSVALCVYIKGEVKSFYFDIRTPNFINDFLNMVFSYAPIIREANKIPNIPDELQYQIVSIFGYNSARFDSNILLPYLSTEAYHVTNAIGDSSFKSIDVSNGASTVRFMDAMAYTTPMPLKKFIKSFGSEGCIEKGIFPYEAFDSSNYDEVLSSSQILPKSAFYSTLNRCDISDEDYSIYVNDIINFDNHWEYLKFYNIKDVEGMISPINNLISNWAQYGIDLLKNYSLSACASKVKYALAYRDFNLHENYNYVDDSKPFELTQKYWDNKCYNYRQQDIIKRRSVINNVSSNDFQYFHDAICNGECYICHAKFTQNNHPTLDRINNKLGHSKDNVQLCCEFCNKFKSNRDEKLMKLRIQLRKYCYLNGLPTTIADDKVYEMLRHSITGGLSNVGHRLNIKDQTHIAHLNYSNKVISVTTTPHVMTHLLGIDFNSLYPSSFSGQYHEFNPYTGGCMFMPGRVLEHIEIKTPAQLRKAYAIIKNKSRFTEDGQLFCATIKGHIPDEYKNEFINFAPIFRNIDITTNESTIGSYMYNFMKDNNIKVDEKQRKLTQLLEVNDFTTFSSYYLWFLMDSCHFVVDDIRSITTFTKHKGFYNFVRTFMDERIKAMNEHNSGKEIFCKISLNGSYGYDGMNTEKFAKNEILNARNTIFRQTRPSFRSTQQLSNSSYLVSSLPDTFTCKTPLQEAVFTLDNAKFWYLTFIYKFMYRCLDMDRIHFIEGDTDSMYWAVAGNPDKDFHQRFDYVIKDVQFYNDNIYKFLPNPALDEGSSDTEARMVSLHDEKKLLGLAIEKEGENCVALAPKCYTIWNNDGTTKSLKLKGVALSKNKDITKDNYVNVISNRRITIGVNVNLQKKNHVMSKLMINKNALTGVHTKMYVFEDSQKCAPLVDGVRYI